MFWLSNLFAVIKELLGFAKQERDPEVIRQAKIRELEQRLDEERAKRDRLLAQPITPKIEEAHAVALGIVFNNILWLRHQIDALKR